MNNLNQIHQHHRHIIELLDQRQLKQALDEINTFINDVSDWDIHTQFGEIQTAYQYMLQYFCQNAVDPQRYKLYDDLLRRTIVINNRLLMAQSEIVDSTLFYTVLREQKNNTQTLADYQLLFESFTEDIAMADLIGGNHAAEEKTRLRQKHEEAQNGFFCKIWTSPQWNTSWTESMHNLLQSVLISVNDLTLAVSAVTLGAAEVFDSQKLMFLFDAYNHKDIQISQRALFGIVLLCMLHEKQIKVEPEIKARLNLLEEHPRFQKEFTNLQITLLRTRETRKADRKMREEIIPEVMKNHRFPINFSELDEKLLLNDKNPEWKQWEENNELTNKIQEMGDMQMEGIDVYMSTFSQLKTFPFFHHLCNWFYPFDPQHSVILNIFSEEEQKKNFIIRNILGSDYFCNSDKYSFCFTAQNIPPKQREMFSMNLEEQNDIPQELMNNKQRKSEVIMRQYVQDLYRFYKIHPRRHEFMDIFEEMDLQFSHYGLLQTFTKQTEYINQVAEFLFYKEYYAEALPFFEMLTTSDAETFQKLGFCYQKEKNYIRAIDAYRKADTLKADTLWTIRHMAQCYRLLGNLTQAISYYHKALEIDPENLSLLQQTGECEIELHEYEQAFTRFFKIDYLQPHSLRTWRSIAWCSFLSGKLEQAKKYNRKLLNEPHPEAIDYLNAGHTEWVCQNISGAASMYIKGSCLLSDPEEFIRLLTNDMEELKKYDISETDVQLMADIIRYGEQSPLESA